MALLFASFPTYIPLKQVGCRNLPLSPAERPNHVLTIRLFFFLLLLSTKTEMSTTKLKSQNCFTLYSQKSILELWYSFYPRPNLEALQ